MIAQGVPHEKPRDELADRLPKRRGRPRGNRVQHLRRESFSHHHPVHVTLRFLPGVYGLRSRRSFRHVEVALRALRKAEDARVVHYAVMGNHIHMIVEASNRVRLSRRIQGFEVRLARALNKMMRRQGKVFADRYHAHVLRTALEAHRAIGYVLRNAAKHYGHTKYLDPYSSASEFTGWSAPVRVSTWSPVSRGDPLIADPTTWLLRAGWRRFGLIDPLPLVPTFVNTMGRAQR